MGGYKSGSLYRGSYSYVFPVTAAVTHSFPSFQSRLAIFLLWMASSFIFRLLTQRMKGAARLAARAVKCFPGPLQHEVIVISDQCNSVRNTISVLRYHGVRTELDLVDTKRAVRKSDSKFDRKVEISHVFTGTGGGLGASAMSARKAITPCRIAANEFQARFGTLGQVPCARAFFEK